MNLTALITNGTNNSTFQNLSPAAGVQFDLLQLDDLEVTTQLTTEEISDKPCGEALSSQTPSTVKLPGSLDALLYIVIVLMFYAFSIVILMVKYIRREREDSSLRNYYHEFVSRDKFRSMQYKNDPFMKRMFNETCDGDSDAPDSLDSEPERPWGFRKKNAQPQTKTKNGNTFSKLRLECDDDDVYTKDKRFTFLGAKSHFCKNNHFGGGFCNKQLCSKCVSENVPTIDWDDETESNISRNTIDMIEVKLHPSVETRSPQRMALLGRERSCCQERYNPRMSALDDHLFSPIQECDSELDLCPNPEIIVSNSSRHSDPHIGSGKIPRESSFDDQVIVSSCSLEVSELLANMPPLGVSNSFSNDMDTLDGLSNLESEAENQSLLNYSSSIWHRNDFETVPPHPQHEGDKMLPIIGTDKSDKLSDRSSLLSCSLSFDDGGKSLTSHPFSSVNLSSTENINVNTNTKNFDVFKGNHKLSLSSSFSFSEKDRDKEMVRLLNDINLLADESGVFKNLKYFLRGFYKSDTDDTTETSNLLPKETYFGPGSPQNMKGTTVSPLKRSNGDIMSIPSIEECLYSDDVVNSLGSHWAYAYDAEDGGLLSDTDRSSSFGDYCMGDRTESNYRDLTRPSGRQQYDRSDVLGSDRVDMVNTRLKDSPYPRKANPMVAGYGPARKETKV